MSNTTSLIIPFNKSIGKGRHSLSSIHSHCEETCMKYGINHRVMSFSGNKKKKFPLVRADSL